VIDKYINKRCSCNVDFLFDHEKLDVYQLELEFLGWATALIDDIVLSPGKYRGELIQQLDRASLSIVFNTAEGNAKRPGRQRAKYLDDARASAMECAACLDASVAKRFASTERVRPGKEILARIASILTKLVQRFDARSRSLRVA
jgi:four helix bundle protein